MDDPEMLADVKAYDAAKRRLYRGQDELIPLEISERRVAGESPVKLWREYRGFSRSVCPSNRAYLVARAW